MKAGEASQPPRDIKETVKALRQAVQVHGNYKMRSKVTFLLLASTSALLGEGVLSLDRSSALVIEVEHVASMTISWKANQVAIFLHDSQLQLTVALNYM
jgi:hypothetical protein